MADQSREKIESTISQGHLQVVPRGDDALLKDGGAHEEIVGYDANIMRARTALSAKEEKRLLRKIDWYLLPLLAVMYMVKTIDAANVC